MNPLTQYKWTEEKEEAMVLTYRKFGKVYLVAAAIFFYTIWRLTNCPPQSPAYSRHESEEIFLHTVLRLPSTDPRLLAYIRQISLYPNNKPYQLAEPEKMDQSQDKQVSIVTDLLGNLTGGTFVECGAFDGELFSNTLYLERYLGWSGILIEPDPKNWRSMVKKNRKAVALNAALGVKNVAEMVQLLSSSSTGGMQQYWTDFLRSFRKNKGDTKTYECVALPLYSILLALNHTRIDYFSLDIEGAELAVLQTIPFQQLDIGLFDIEYYQYKGDEDANAIAQKRLNDIREFFSLSAPEYKEVAKTGSDVFFIKTRQGSAAMSHLLGL